MQTTGVNPTPNENGASGQLSNTDTSQVQDPNSTVGKPATPQTANPGPGTSSGSGAGNSPPNTPATPEAPDGKPGGSRFKLALGLGIGGFLDGYVHNAMVTHTLVSLGNLKAGTDTGAFTFCLVASANLCGAVGLGATGTDYTINGLTTHEWRGENLKNAATYGALDTVGYAFAKFLEIPGELIQSNIEGSMVPAEGTSAGAGVRGAALNAATKAAAGRGLQVAFNNANWAVNYKIGTLSCTNPLPLLNPGYCPG